MKSDEIIREIVNNIPEDILEIPERLQKQGINKEIKLCYYLYKELTKKMLEADIEFHVADNYEQKVEFFAKDSEQLESNKVVCKHINQLYIKLIKEAVDRYEKENINLDIKAEIELLHPENEITHSDTIVECKGRTIFCNPILDLLESKAKYRIIYFARSLEQNKTQEYVSRLREKYGEFFYLNQYQIQELDEDIENKPIQIYRNDFEDILFRELKEANESLEENRKKENLEGSDVDYTESGLYPYLNHNKEKYGLNDSENLQKSKIDFILDRLSNITEDEIETNVMSKYLYYIRLIRRVFKENPIGDYNILTCKYKEGKNEEVILLLLLKIGKNNFSYMLSDEIEKFKEIPVKELRQQITRTENPLIIYNRPYRKETGPLSEEETDKILEEL